MTLADAFCKDLSPIAGAIHKEAVLCAQLASEQAGFWEEDSERMVSFTYASGVGQIIHLQRALLLEALDLETASALNPA